LERAPSVDDQRNRLVAAWVAEPKPFHFNNSLLAELANHWKFSSVITFGSGRPANATMAGDANQDGNIYNDRLPGYKRNAFLGPNYFTTDLRVAHNFPIGTRARLELLA